MNIRRILLTLLIIGGSVCLWVITRDDLTGRESGLVGVVLAILSILGSWLVTHIYAESQHEKAIQKVQEFHRSNLQTYARKAAEKVTNLSKELGRLASYLGDELERPKVDNPKEALHSREERMTSAIHVVNTLKSVNDTALSDWEGVIDDLLKQQKDEKEEKEEEFLELVERLSPLFEDPTQVSSPDETESIRGELQDIRRDLRSMAAGMGITHLPRPSKKRTRHTVELPCPECGGMLKYRQRPYKNGFKSVECSQCKATFVSRYLPEDGFALEKREVREEMTACPECNAAMSVRLDTLPHTSVDVSCGQCGATLKVARRPSGVLRIRTHPKSKTTPDGGEPRKQILTDEITEKVFEALPEQPWPKGVHKQLAEELGMRATTISRAITALTRQGKVRLQIDGVVYAPTDNQRPPDRSQRPGPPISPPTPSASSETAT